MRSTSCHMKVHDAAMRVFEKVLERYGKEEIHKLKLDVFDGCLNVRPMRGGQEYSMHSWGIAFDFAAAYNQLKWHKERALFGRKEYEGWFEAWESQGATSLGRARNFDWMHVQFARL